MSKFFFMIATAFSLLTGIAQAEQNPLKVFILAGQSNMQGHAHIRTFAHIGKDSKTEPLLRQLQSGDGKPHVFEKIWISSLSSNGEKHGQLTTGFGANQDKIGPELTFGITMQKRLNEPILIIKTAWGGKSLHTDFRSPSAGAYVFNENQIKQFEKQEKDFNVIKAAKAKATGHYYRLMIEHVKKILSDIKRVYPNYQSSQGYQLAGFVWFQGWNDMVDRGTYPNRDKPGGYDQYSEVLKHFIRDVRKDLSVANLPVVVGVMGVGGPTDKYLPQQRRYKDIHQNFRDAMSAVAALPEFKGNVVNVLTENYWDHELVSLRARDAQINQKLKKLQREKKISRQELNTNRNKLRAEEFTKQELDALENGISNFEFHYLGSAKIMAQIGKGFAEKMPLVNSEE